MLLDSVEKLHVIDRQTQEELETIEISEVQLVYNSSHFKSLATGGNVSEALVGASALLLLAASASDMPRVETWSFGSISEVIHGVDVASWQFMFPFVR